MDGLKILINKEILKERNKKMEFSNLTESERHAMVYLYHLQDRAVEHYKIFINLKAIDKVIVKFIHIRSAVKRHCYSMKEIEQLRDICSSFKDWDGHHYFLFLTLRVIDFLLEKLEEKSKPRCKKCGGELSLWQEGTPLKSMTIFCYKCKSTQFSIPFEDVMQLIYKKYEEAN